MKAFNSWLRQCTTAIRVGAFGFYSRRYLRMRSALLVLTFALVSLFFLGSASIAQELISDCGILQYGVEAGCIIFVSDHYGHFLVSGDISPYSVGDRVYVEGSAESCVTTCMQGLCLTVDSIAACGGTSTSCRLILTIRGEVVDSITRRPVAGAIVDIDDERWCSECQWPDYCFQNLHTNSNGQFLYQRTCTFGFGQDMNVCPCLTIQAPGYETYRQCLICLPVLDPCIGQDKLRNITWGPILLKPIGTDIDDRELSELPTEFQLEQNYPNPFNPETRIEFSIPRRSFVTIEVLNILGTTVRLLVNEHLSAGHKVVTWNGRDDNEAVVSSGIYIYRIIADDFVQSKKMMLMK